jgi:hypothetical protein
MQVEQSVRQQAQQRLIALKQKKSVLVEELAKASSEKLDIKTRFGNGRRIPDKEYKHLAGLHVAVLKKIYDLQAKLTSLGSDIRVVNEELSRGNHAEYLAEKRLGTVDEFDLANQLCEPQMLLRLAVVRLEQLMKRTGFGSGDRELLDSIGDYLRRHGISI